MRDEGADEVGAGGEFGLVLAPGPGIDEEDELGGEDEDEVVVVCLAAGPGIESGTDEDDELGDDDEVVV